VKPSLLVSLAFTAFASAGLARADVTLAPMFGDHMVLQREMAVPVWGQAAPGEKVTVTFRDQTKSATAGADGAWQVKLDALKAGGPDKLVAAGANTVTLDDVLVGEVWLGSGQSNMAMGCGGYTANDSVLATNVAAIHPQLRLLRGSGPGWSVAGPTTSAGFSALLFSFGVPLQKALDVPVGLMAGAVGGTPSGYWLSEAALQADGPCQELVKKTAATYDPVAAQKKYEADLVTWEKAAADAKAKQQREPRKPNPPVAPGLTSGGKVGHLYEQHIRPKMPFAIRGVLWDQGESGTALAGIDQYTLMGALISGWRREWNQGDFPFIYIQKPSGGGCAWDPANPVTRKAEAFTALPAAVPNDGGGVETHVRIMTYPNTAMAISSDLGPNTHPECKSGYGVRAATVALGAVYGRPVEYYGPLYASHAVEGGTIRVKFTHVGQGLAFRNGDKLQGFAVAGADKVFQWADAVIDGDSVVVSSAKVPQPVNVRYAWAGKRTWANLFNKDGLPAIPFRTDR
jgi:sialate O-acetylesterase